jgi:hypothetical protein
MSQRGLALPEDTLFGGKRANWLGGQSKDLVYGRTPGDQRSFDQAFSGLPQRAQIDLQKGTDPVVMIEAQPLTIGHCDEKEINQDLLPGQVADEPAGDKPMIDPTEGARNLPDPVRIDEPSCIHRRRLRV